MVTLKDIAEKCNVSAATVSNILNGKSKAGPETTKLVMDVANELGYKPNYVAQNLRRKSTKEIAVIAEDITQFSTPTMIESIMEYFEERGYRVIVQNLRMYARWQDTWYDKDSAFHSILDPAIEEVLSMRVDGIIYLAGHARDIRCFDDDFPIPAVMGYGYATNMQVPSVVIDDEDAGYQVTKYLISKGKRRIGIVSGRSDNMHSEHRLLGYQKALFEADIPYNPSWIYYGEWVRETGYEAAKQFAGQNLDAIFTFADQMAVGVMDYLREKNVNIGDEISVCGFDNQDFSSYLSPSLTTMEIPLAEIGIKTAELLYDKLVAEEPIVYNEKKVIPMKCRLVERDSVK